MKYFHYDNYGLVDYCGKTYRLSQLDKDSKTRTLNAGDGFTAVIQTEDIRISPITYWNVGNWDAQFQQNDANCYLCGWYGGTGGSCKCKKNFTVEEHSVNVLIARKNFLLTVLKNYFPKLVKEVKGMSDEEIHSILYERSKEGNRILKMDLPSGYSYREEAVKEMEKHLVKCKLL